MTASLRCLFVSSVLFWAAAASAAPITSFDDIRFWVGTGANRAALVIDWQNGAPPLAWGYRWDGAATGADMVNAIARANLPANGGDSRLYVNQLSFSFGPAVFGWGYDSDGDNGGSFAINPAPPPTNPAENSTPTDPADVYREGFFVSGFWGYFTADGLATLPSSAQWQFASVGFGGRVLADGSWDGWSYTTDLITFVGPPPSAAVFAAEPVPEPAPVLAVAGLGVGIAVMLRRRSAGRRAAA